MYKNTGTSDVDRRFRVMVIIWWALMLSVAVYVTMAHLVSVGSADASFLRPLALVLGAVAAVELGVQRYFFGLMRDAKLFPGTIDPGKNPLAGRGVDYSGLAPEERAPLLILGARTTLSIILWALGESIVIYGLVLALISGSPAWMYPFALVGAGTMVLYRPRRSEIDEQLERWRRWHAIGAPLNQLI